MTEVSAAAAVLADEADEAEAAAAAAASDCDRAASRLRLDVPWRPNDPLL